MHMHKALGLGLWGPKQTGLPLGLGLPGPKQRSDSPLDSDSRVRARIGLLNPRR
jgi:hypothetical protein